jgi:predicted amidophosphoribosyltransferase
MKTNCIFCGEEIDFEDIYCAYCGQPQKDNIEGETSSRICPVCGAENAPDSNHCIVCCSIFI